MQFSDVLASSIHDIKNSLGMIMNTLDSVLCDPGARAGDQGQANVLQLEAQRANSNLNQLLALYKLENGQLAPLVAEHSLEDLVDEIVAENGSLMHKLGVELAAETDGAVAGYFDDTLVRGVLNSVIGHAQRYTQDRIDLRATQEDGYLVFRVEDNGAGFPAHMLTDAAEDARKDTPANGHPQIGLYFAAVVAQMHVAGERRGHIRLYNGHTLPGGCFELWLP